MSTGRWSFKKTDLKRALECLREAGFPAPTVKVVDGGFELFPGAPGTPGPAESTHPQDNDFGPAS
jgi:hypothetical protein